MISLPLHRWGSKTEETDMLLAERLRGMLTEAVHNSLGHAPASTCKPREPSIHSTQETRKASTPLTWSSSIVPGSAYILRVWLRSLLSVAEVTSRRGCSVRGGDPVPSGK